MLKREEVKLWLVNIANVKVVILGIFVVTVPTGQLVTMKFLILNLLVENSVMNVRPRKKLGTVVKVLL